MMIRVLIWMHIPEAEDGNKGTGKFAADANKSANKIALETVYRALFKPHQN